MNTSNLENPNQLNNGDNHYVKRLQYLMKSNNVETPFDNGNPAGFNAIAESLQRGIQPDSYKNAQDILNKKCLPVQTARNRFLENVFKKALLVPVLILGFSFNTMAQTPSPKTNIIVTSHGETVNLSVLDTTYLNGRNQHVRVVINNFKNAGVIKNNDMAEMIIGLLKAKK